MNNEISFKGVSDLIYWQFDKPTYAYAVARNVIIELSEQCYSCSLDSTVFKTIENDICSIVDSCAEVSNPSATVLANVFMEFLNGFEQKISPLKKKYFALSKNPNSTVYDPVDSFCRRIKKNSALHPLGICAIARECFKEQVIFDALDFRGTEDNEKIREYNLQELSEQVASREICD